MDLLDDDLDVEERNALVVALNDELQQVMTQHLRQTNISIRILKLSNHRYLNVTVHYKM